MQRIKEVYVRWVGIPLLSFVLVFVVKDESYRDNYFLKSFFICFIFTSVIWNGIFLIIKWNRSRYKEIDQTAKRLFFTSLFATIFLILVSNVIALFLGLCSFDNFLEPQYFFRNAHVSFISSLIVAAIYEASYFFYKWKDSVVQNQALKTQQIKIQYGVLQNQMSPHFLFNSLNTLTALISEDQDVAIDFTQTLAEVYRYILQNKERELVSLEEELEFCESYVFLLKKRYPENLDVYFSVPKNSKYIAPLTVQMLIENAIKHNVISKNAPLAIDISVKEDCLVVSNKLQIKKSLEKSTKTGLDNIQKRYVLLGGRSIDVQKSNSIFEVRIPLIELVSETDYLKSAI